MHSRHERKEQTKDNPKLNAEYVICVTLRDTIIVSVAFDPNKIGRVNFPFNERYFLIRGRKFSFFL